MTDSRFTEIGSNPDILSQGWNQPFRTISPEDILKGTQLDFRMGNKVVTLSTEPESEKIKPIKRGSATETLRVNLIVDIMQVKGEHFAVHIETPDPLTHTTPITYKGKPRRSQNGNVQSFPTWQKAIRKGQEGKTIYSHKAEPLVLTALDLQNSQIIINRE